MKPTPNINNQNVVQLNFVSTNTNQLNQLRGFCHYSNLTYFAHKHWQAGPPTPSAEPPEATKISQDHIRTVGHRKVKKKKHFNPTQEKSKTTLEFHNFHNLRIFLYVKEKRNNLKREGGNCRMDRRRKSYSTPI